MTEEPAQRAKRKKLRWFVLFAVAVVCFSAWWHDSHPGHHYECTTSGNVFAGERDCLVGP